MNDNPLPQDPDRWPSNPYELLGISDAEDMGALDRSYNTLVDRFTPEAFPREHKMLTEAYETLRERNARQARFFDEEPQSSRSTLEGLGKSFLDVDDDPWKMESLSLDTEKPGETANFEVAPLPSEIEPLQEFEAPEESTIVPTPTEPVLEETPLAKKTVIPDAASLEDESWREVPDDQESAIWLRHCLVARTQQHSSAPQAYLRLYWLDTIYPCQQKPEEWLTAGLNQTGDRQLLDLLLGCEDFDYLLSDRIASLYTVGILTPAQVYELAVRRVRIAAAQRMAAEFYRKERKRLSPVLASGDNHLWGKYLCQIREAIGFADDAPSREVAYLIREDLEHCPSLSATRDESMHWYNLFESASEHDFDQLIACDFIPHATHFVNLLPLLSVDPCDAESVWLAFLRPLVEDPGGSIRAVVEFGSRCPVHFKLFQRRIDQLAAVRGTKKISQPCSSKVSQIFRGISTYGKTSSGATQNEISEAFRRDAVLYCLANKIEIGSFLEQLKDDTVQYNRGQQLVEQLPALETFARAYYAFHFCGEGDKPTSGI